MVTKMNLPTRHHVEAHRCRQRVHQQADSNRVSQHDDEKESRKRAQVRRQGSDPSDSITADARRCPGPSVSSWKSNNFLVLMTEQINNKYNGM